MVASPAKCRARTRNSVRARGLQGSIRLVVALALRLRAGRRTNLALLLLLAAAVVTGSLAFAIGGSWVPWVVVTHGVVGLGFVALAPWKSVISARGLRHRRPQQSNRDASSPLVVAG